MKRTELPRAFVRVRDRIRGAIEQAWPAPPPQREERFTSLIQQAIGPAAVTRELEKSGGISVAVEVFEAFGKPMLVSFDLSVTPEQVDEMAARLLAGPDQEARLKSYRIFVLDVLDRAARAVWDNPVMVPVALRGRVLIRDPQGGPSTQLFDLRSLGFVDETARPGDTYEKYGAPAGDPNWQP